MLKCLGVNCTDNDNFFVMHQKIKWTGRNKDHYAIKNNKEQNSRLLMSRVYMMSVWVFTEIF